MASEKNKQVKSKLHARNKNRERYDLNALTSANPELKIHVILNKFGEESVDFSNPNAVKILNWAILKYYYGIKYWEFPDENLCPPIPGRADYIHYIADLLAETNFNSIPTGNNITCYDVGTGASCIYPIIGAVEYGWNFIGSDIDQKSIASAQNIIDKNLGLSGKIQVRLQINSDHFFNGVLKKDEKIDIVICNPPFHASVEDAQKGSRRKIKNLSGKKVKIPELNFAGINNELIYDGGESRFIKNMIRESEVFSKNCLWFSTLVSKQSTLKDIYIVLEKVGAKQVKTIPMGTGNKTSRIVVWTFLSVTEQSEWSESKW